MNVALIILGHLFTFVAAFAGLLLALNFTKAEFAVYPILHWLDGKQLPLAVTTVVSLVIVFVTNLFKDVKNEFETVQGPKGEAFQKATESGFEKELKDAADDLKVRAKRFFEAAEKELKPGSYEDAARNYQKSIDLLPTMSAYLNVGISWYYVSNYPKAEQVFLTGLQLARQKGDKRFEGNFLGNIGNVYCQQGKLNEALKSYQQALEIHKHIVNPLGEAANLGNIGVVYANQGKLNEALRSYQQALEIHKHIVNPLGEAADLGNIGIVYYQQGNLNEALGAYQQALEIDKKISNSLGEAADLVNIGNVYYQQGKLNEALGAYQQALEVHKNIGNSHGLVGCLGNIGIVYYQQGKLNEALEFYQQAFEIAREIGDQLGQATQLGYIGIVYRNQGKLDDALRFMQQARDIFERIGTPRELEMAERNIKRITEQLQGISKKSEQI
jgi:tetratricopeptide (TPR) repeat protein